MRIITQEGLVIMDAHAPENLRGEVNVDGNDIWYYDGKGTSIMIASYENHEEAEAAYGQFLNELLLPEFDFRLYRGVETGKPVSDD